MEVHLEIGGTGGPVVAFKSPIDVDTAIESIYLETGIEVNGATLLGLLYWDLPYPVDCFYCSLLDIHLYELFFEEVKGTTFERDHSFLLHTFGSYIEAIKAFFKMDFYPNISLDGLLNKFCENGKFGKIDEYLERFINYEKLKSLVFKDKNYCETPYGVYFMKGG